MTPAPRTLTTATPAAAAVAASLERDMLREALLSRSMNLQMSARAAVLPTNEPIVSTPRIAPRPMTERPITNPVEPTTPRTKMMDRALRARGQAPERSGQTTQNFVHKNDAITFGEGPEGRPISRMPDKKWFTRNEQSALAFDSEYASNFCHEIPRQQLDQMLSMTFNDRKIQRETKVDISHYPRTELRTALMGWGPRMRQIYVPDIKTDSNELHRHYTTLGIPHEYHGDDLHMMSSPAGGKKAGLLQPRTAPVAGHRRPSIKALQNEKQDEQTLYQGQTPSQGNSLSMLSTTSRRPDGSPSMATTEYRGQFCKNLSMDGTLERTQMFVDGPIDFDLPEDLEKTKQSIRLRQSRESGLCNTYKDLVYAKDAAKRENITVGQVYQLDKFRTLNDPFGTERNAVKRHRPVPVNAQSPRCIPHVATLQKDVAWQPEGILQSLSGHAGPCQITSQRTGFYGIQQAHSPRRQVKWGHTRVDRRPHYALDINVEGLYMGFPKPDRYSDENSPTFKNRSADKDSTRVGKAVSKGGSTKNILNKPSRE